MYRFHFHTSLLREVPTEYSSTHLYTRESQSILKLICITRWNIQLRWRNSLKLKNIYISDPCQQITNMGFTVCRTSPWISTGSSSVAGKNRCGSKKAFKVAEVLAPRQASLQPASISPGVCSPILPIPPLQAAHWVGPAGRAAQEARAGPVVQPSWPNQAASPCSGPWKLGAEPGLSSANRGAVGCQKAVS